MQIIFSSLTDLLQTKSKTTFINVLFEENFIQNI